MSKSLALYYLNQMEVIESNGGEEAYATVKDNEENRELLQKAGVPLETALQFGGIDNEDFCLLATSYTAGVANFWTGEHLMYLEELDELDKSQEENQRYKQTLEKIKRNTLSDQVYWMIDAALAGETNE